MRISTLLNQCHPLPGFVYGRATPGGDDEQSILIAIRPRKRSRAICSGCHRPATGYDQSRTPRRFEFIGIWGYLVFFVYYMRRVDCKQCGIMVEEVPWGLGKHSSTYPAYLCPILFGGAVSHSSLRTTILHSKYGDCKRFCEHLTTNLGSPAQTAFEGSLW